MSNISMTPLLDFFEEMERKRRNLVTRSLLYVEPSPETLLGHESLIFLNTVVNLDLPIPVFGLTFPEFLRRRIERRLKETGLSILPHFATHSVFEISEILAPKGILNTSSVSAVAFEVPESISKYLVSLERIEEWREEAERELWEMVAKNLFDIMINRFFWIVGRKRRSLVPYIFTLYLRNSSLYYDPSSRSYNDLPLLRWNTQYAVYHPLLIEQFPLAFGSPYH